MTPDAALRGSFRRSAIVHDWLTIPGGSEKVLLELLELLPDAELFTSVYDPERWPGCCATAPSTPRSWTACRARSTHYPKLLPLMNSAFESFDLSGFDLVVSSSHSCAKNVLTGADTLHVCYCHTPMRHAWEPRHLAGELGGGSALRRAPAAGPAAARRPGRSQPPRRLRGQLDPRGRRGSASTTAATPSSYIRLWTWSATFTVRGVRTTTTWCSDGWCPTSGSSWRLAPAPRWGGA